MTLRKGHGTGAGVPRIEVLPADELPAGVPDVARQESPRDRRIWVDVKDEPTGAVRQERRWIPLGNDKDLAEGDEVHPRTEVGMRSGDLSGGRGR